MIRHTININNYQFVADYYDANVDLGHKVTYSNYVMFRNFKVMNDIVCDTDIYIVEKSLYEKYKEDIINDDISDSLVFPVLDNFASSYSRNSSNFSSRIDNDSIKNDEDAYYIYDLEKYNETNTLQLRNIKNNVIRIYHPHIKTSIKSIIKLENYINDIHFIYLCYKYEDYDTNSETEFKINNNLYSEYITVYFPNIDDLFSDENKCCYLEDLNIVISSKNREFIDKILNTNVISYKKDIDNKYDNYNYYDIVDKKNVQVIPLSFLIHPFRIIKEVDNITGIENFVKLYININKTISNNYLTYPVTLIISPYTGIDNTSNLYLLSDVYKAGNETFLSKLSFSLSSKLGFYDNKISIINEFNYPYKTYFDNVALISNDNLSEDETDDLLYTNGIQEAYKYYNNISDKLLEKYDLFLNPNNEQNKYGNFVNQIKEIDELEYLTDYQELLLSKLLTEEEFNNLFYTEDYKTSMLEKYKKIMKDYIIKEYKEDNEITPGFFGFRITIASDPLLKNKILIKTVDISSFGGKHGLDNFAFDLTNIFDNWLELPPHLIAKVEFIDNILGVILAGNIVVIHKEFFKYMINYSFVGQIHDLTNINNNMKEYKLKTGEDNVNFINNINCIIKKDDEYKNLDSSNFVNKNKPSVIYMPIFYRVQELNTIRLEAGLTQNIGVNLVNYMTKVETFKLVLDGNEYIESSRNNIYVIFKINAVELSNSYGRYHIMDENNELISSGSWAIR